MNLLFSKVSFHLSISEILTSLELGINFSHIKTKSVTVMNPFKPVDVHIMDDTDLAGPLFFCLLFGSFLLLVSELYYIIKCLIRLVG